MKLTFLIQSTYEKNAEPYNPFPVSIITETFPQETSCSFSYPRFS